MSRDNILNKVRAMLSKTVDNGCTEAEAMLAFEMAEKMMEAHSITEDDLKLEDEKAIIDSMYVSRDPYAISWKICYFVGKFTETYAYGHKAKINFVGLKSDVDFALWLNQMLTKFVQSELKTYMWKNNYQSLPPAPKRKMINGFVIGCCGRISSRLNDMTERRKTVVNSTALVLAKNALIEDAIKDKDIRPEDSRGRKPVSYREAYEAGKQSGEKANFGRPVEDNSGLMMIEKQ